MYAMIGMHICMCTVRARERFVRIHMERIIIKFYTYVVRVVHAGIYNNEGAGHSIDRSSVRNLTTVQGLYDRNRTPVRTSTIVRRSTYGYMYRLSGV